jgi:hypothetical protein
MLGLTMSSLSLSIYFSMPLGALYMIQFESHLQQMLGGFFGISKNHYFQF